jgi:pimeloyl-ACP methyl ester carboxylesterase
VWAIRLVAICAAGFLLAGCGTLILDQKPDEVIVRVADKPDIYPARAVAGVYAPYATLAALAYHDTGSLAGWTRIPLRKYVCPVGHICAGEVGEQLWIHRVNGSCREAVVVFRGTVASQVDDWLANFHWLHRLTPFDDYYDQARGNIANVVEKAEGLGCAGRIIAVGHSLGGGLAQHVSYADERIRTAYTFDPSFVIGANDFNWLGQKSYAEGAKFDYVYEHGEILAFLRFIGRQFRPYTACNPRIRTVRFNTLTGSIFNQHRIDDLAAKLVAISSSAAKPGAPAPPAKKYKLNAGCPKTV